MKRNDSTTEKSNAIELGTMAGALIKLGLLTAGTQIGTAAIHRVARYPALVFGLGLVTGMYVAKNRKKIIREAKQIGYQGKHLFKFNAGNK